MCTSLSLTAERRYFGRTLDIHLSHGEEVTVMPRAFRFETRRMGVLDRHYAVIGMAKVMCGVPLYFDGVNEHGLGGAGLNFPTLAVYREPQQGKDNIASFELLPLILSSCRNTAEVKAMLRNAGLTRDSFRSDLPPTPLHWMFSGDDGSVVIEAVEEGLMLYDAPVGVLANCPDFPSQLQNLSRYSSCFDPIKRGENSPPATGRSPAGQSIPGGISSPDRFVRCAAYRAMSPTDCGREEGLSQFFDILGSVAVPRGSCVTALGEHHFTRYTSCCDTKDIIYYHRRYGHSVMFADRLSSYDIDGKELFVISRRGSMNTQKL